MKKFVKSALVITAFIAGFAILYCLLFEALIMIDSSIAHRQIRKYGIAMEESYVYIDEDEMESATPVTTILEKLPAPIVDALKRDWIIFVAENPPEGEIQSSLIVGTTYPRAKVIWLAPDFTEDVLLHEVGHAFASINNLDMSKEFLELYNVFWDKYYEWSDENNDSHGVGTAIEFFAMLFEQYISTPEELKANFKEGYDYMDNAISSFGNTQNNRIIAPFIRAYNLASYSLRRIGKSGISLATVSNIDNQVKNNPLIQPEDYNPSVRLAGLNSQDRELFNLLLDIVEHPENHADKPLSEIDEITIDIDYYITYSSYNKVAACIDAYLGQEVSDVFDVNSSQTYLTSTIVMHVDTLLQLKQNREEYVANVDKVLAELHEGTETQKLLQISKYITQNCTYEIKERTSEDDFWTNGKGDCVTYALVFRQFCERLGIQCDMIYGITPTGEYHVWNRVKLSDGSYRYYDLTHYKIGAVNIENYDRHTVMDINSYLPG